MQNSKRRRLLLLIGLLVCLLAPTTQAPLPASTPIALAAPLESSPAAEVDIAQATRWSAIRYLFVNGATLRPRSSATQWRYAGAGCIYASTGNDVFNIHLNIPHGSRVDYLRIYFHDSSSGNSQSWVTVYDGADATTDLTTVSSSGSSGKGTALSAYVGHVVNTATRSYVLNWRPNQTGTAMQLCGLRVAYRVPMDVTHLPMIRK